MHRLTILFLILLAACSHSDLPKSTHVDQLVQRPSLGYVRFSIDEKAVCVNDKKLNEIADIPRLLSNARDTSRENSDLAAIIYAHKDCNYYRVDSIINKIREAAVLRISFKTNSYADASYINTIFHPPGEFGDSLANDILFKCKARPDSMNALIVNKISRNTFAVNNSELTRHELFNKLEHIIQDSVWYHYLIHPDGDSKVEDVIEMVDYFDTVVARKRDSLAWAIHGQAYDDIDKLQKHHIKRRFRKTRMIILQD